MPEIQTAAPITRSESLGGFTLRASVVYLGDVQVWEPRISIEHPDPAVQSFTVPCGPECYRKSSDAALQVGWATGRSWLDGGRIPWKLHPVEPLAASPSDAV